MSAKEFKEREADALSTRRSRLEKGRRREFDGFYGKQKGRGRSEAGKGDSRRPTNEDRYSIGIRLATENLSDAERLELEREWYKLGGQIHPADR